MTMIEHGSGKRILFLIWYSTNMSSLKTRERYVQLSEHKLEEKKKHCEFLGFYACSILIGIRR
jgi:hypothetical protein